MYVSYHKLSNHIEDQSNSLKTGMVSNNAVRRMITCFKQGTQTTQAIINTGLFQYRNVYSVSNWKVEK